MGIRIIGTGVYLPTTIESVNTEITASNNKNDDLAWMFSGGQQHRVCQHHETPTYMGMLAAKNALANGHIDPKTIDAVICYSGIEDNETPKDVYGMMSEIGCDGAMAWSIDTACASFLSHLNCAHALSLMGKQRLLIIDSMNWVNRAFDVNKCSNGPEVLIGDGAGALVVEAVTGRGCIINALEKTSTADFDFVTMKSAQNTGSREYLAFTKSKRIIHRAFSILPETAQELLDMSGFSKNDITWTFCHQPGINAMHKWHEVLDIPFERNLNTFHMYGNMSTANIPVTLNHFLTVNPKIKRGDIILAFTAGAGIHCAATLIEY